MPQFDPAAWPSQILWLVLCFATLFFLMWRIALPRISEILEERDHKINDNLRKAELLREDAEGAMAAYEKTMADARLRAQDTLRSVRERAATDAAERNTALSERLSSEITAAEARIAEERSKAVAGVRDIATEIAQVATERLGGSRVTKAAATTAVTTAMEGRIA